MRVWVGVTSMVCVCVCDDRATPGYVRLSTYTAVGIMDFYPESRDRETFQPTTVRARCMYRW
jgi:hypothetical protein